MKIVLFGGISPQQLQCFDQQAVVLPWVGYDAYAAALGRLADILIAPLDRSRTSMSKCPLKYLDYSVAGAAGVYSDMRPYSDAIIDGKTGLLVRGDDAMSWAAPLARLIEDEGLRRSIVRAARRDIQHKYETAVIAGLCRGPARSDRRSPPRPGPGALRSVPHDHACPLLPLAAPLRRRADAGKPGDPAGPLRGRSSRVAVAGDGGLVAEARRHGLR